MRSATRTTDSRHRCHNQGPTTGTATAGATPRRPPHVTDQPSTDRARSGPSRRQPRDDCLARQAPRVRLPQFGNLRRHQRRLGLRPPWRRAEKQRQARLVAGDGPGARRHRRPRRRHPDAPPGLGHVRSRRFVRDPLVECARAVTAFGCDELPGTESLTETDKRDPTSSSAWASSARSPGPARPPRRFNLMFKTFMGPVENDAAVSTCAPRPRRASTSTSRTCSTRRARSCPSASPRSARPSATRSPRQLRLPDARVRADGDAVLRPPGDAARASTSGCRAAGPGTRATAYREERLRFREHAPDELAHYAKKAIDIEYRFPFGWKELEGIHNRGDCDLGAPSRRAARTWSTSIPTRRTSSRGSSRPPAAPTAPRSRS